VGPHPFMSFNDIDRKPMPRKTGTMDIPTYTEPSPCRAASITGDTFHVDLNAIQRAVLEQQRNGGAQVPEKDQLYADSNGEIVLGGEGRDTSRMAKVEADTFYVDLNAIQRAVLEQQRNGGAKVADKDQLYADSNGEIVLGGEGRDTSRMAKVEADTFFARDLAMEARTVAKMPASYKVSDGTYEGYVYKITNAFNDTYELFIYYHDGYQVYRVALISPRLGGEVNAHGCHLWPDGTICLTPLQGSGYPSMEETYSKSALWTLGASLFQRGHGFQLNAGQAG